MISTQMRIVIVLNETIDVGRLINAASHLAMGFGASRTPDEREALGLLEYRDKDDELHSNISGLSLIVLRARPLQLAKLRLAAIKQKTFCMDFTNTMTGGSYEDQLVRMRETTGDSLVYYGVLMYGSNEELRPLTKKFSLFSGDRDRGGLGPDEGSKSAHPHVAEET
ncbi:MAG: DUF2000 domain-containing protein [Acidobacteria bacterium]|nr:DUF2000 domain-containing protein [Acidobacteriota bacterium]